MNTLQEGAVDIPPPSYEEATWQSRTGRSPSSRLPAYRYSRCARFHPYPRFNRHGVGETLEGDDLFNTIFDDARVELDIPPPPAGGRRPTAPLDIQAWIHQEVERALDFDRRVHRLMAQNVMIDFVIGVRRAHRR